MELEQWLRALQPGIQAPGSDDGAAVEGGAGGADKLTEAERQRQMLDLEWAFETSKPTSVTPPPSRL